MKTKKKISFLIFVVIILFSSCEKEVSVSPPEAEPPQGFIFVDSNPQNYKIYLDKRFTGRFTPDTLPYVEETEHLVELKRKYWLDSNAVTLAEHNVTKSIYIDFFQNPRVYGSLRLESQPDSSIIEINDSVTSEITPAVIEGLIPGIYHVKYYKEKHRPAYVRTIVESNRETKVILTLQDTSIWVDYTTKNSELPSNNITALAVDLDNRVWVGTALEGLVTIKGSNWEFINKSNSNLPSDSIRVINVDKQNTIWIGTSEGLVEYKSGAINRIFDKSNTPIKSNNQINAIQFYNDIIFVATQEGLLQIENNSSTLIKIRNNFGEDRISALAADEINKQLWVGFVGDLFNYMIVNGNEIRRNKLIGDVGSSVKDLHLTQMKIHPSDGKLWALFSTVSGFGQEGDLIHLPSYLTIWNGEKWFFQMIGIAESNLFLTDITFDKSNFAWITTSQGLRKHSSIRDAFIYRSYNSGLFNDDLTSVTEDKNGTLWIGSHYGLFKYKKNLEP